MKSNDMDHNDMPTQVKNVDIKSTESPMSPKASLPEGFSEDRFRVDRKRLEQLLSQSVKLDNNNNNQQNLTRAEAFFIEVMNSTSTQVSWPSKLKVGAKSKKDPHIKITGPIEQVKIAKEKIMQQLDSKSSRVTIKMDVSHTDHSHVIGKGGANIKQVMSETECHIHFPDSNRNSFITEKSNQVSIAGQAAGVEKARQRIRDLLPITMYFDFHTKHLVPIDLNTPAIQNIVQTYNISVQIKSKKPYINVIQVKGCVSNTLGLKDGVICLMQLLTGQIGQSLPVRSNVEIQNVASFMNAKNIAKIKQIQNTTGIHIELPSLEPSEFHARNLSNRRLSSGPDQPIIIDKQVVMTGTIEGILYARQEIINNLPLVLMFDFRLALNML
jgi:protein bicaudal C